MLASEIVHQASAQLLDETGQTWSRAELAAYVTDAQRAIVGLKPEAFSRTAVVKLQPGARQVSPGSRLNRVIRNMHKLPDPEPEV